MSWSRRAFLGGAAATVALPYLPSLVRGARADTTPPTRVLFFFVPNGVHQANWGATGSGADFTLGTTLAQLDDLKSHLLVVDGMGNAGGTDNRAGDHARGTGSFLTCQRPSFDGVEVGESIDQVIAAGLGDATAFPSLELGVQSGGSVGICDSGYSCAYTQNIAWSGPTTPVPKITNPQVAFDRLFAGSDGVATAEEQLRRGIYRTSVLDLVKDQATRLKTKVAVDDRARLDEYFTSVRDIERRASGVGACGPEEDLPDSYTLQTHPDLMLDIIVSAFQCDLTRVATFMIGNAGSDQAYSFLPGVNGGHHQLSHHQNMAANLDQLAVIDAWEVERFGRLLRRMSQIPEGSGSMLDHTIVYLSSEIGDGNRHNHDNLPVLIGGGQAVGVAGGRAVQAPGQPVANLYLAIARAMGVDVQGGFGLDGTGPVSWLAG
ncbi:MAG: DUF1552 domain-containing protein [Alphaproteobacteria bacterium]|nr:DUF1552 domain-containing protein [Alphaproteobacteria bacterium]